MPETPVRQANYQIAAGNNNAAGLVTLEGTQADAEDYPRTFGTVRSYGFYDPGLQRVKPSGEKQFSGYPTTSWQLAVVTKAQEKYLRDTYCSGGYSGLVTVRTTTDNNDDSFANYNAVIWLPKLSEQDWVGRYSRNYVIQFRKMVAL
jgi:hypothetical protein